MTDGDLIRTAYHEAGHVVAAHILGGTVELVSIRPGRHVLGTAWCSGPTWATLDDYDVMRRVLPIATLAPDRIRRDEESEIIWYLAGVLAERFAPRAPETPSDLMPPDFSNAETQAAGLSRLSPRHRELVEAATTSEDRPRTDDQAARERATFLARYEAEEFIGWLTAVANRLVENCRPMIEALADELLRRTEVPGPEAVALIEQVRLGRKGSA